MNDFQFIDDSLSGPNRQHDARRLENGNIMIFDNGDQRDIPLTRITEYLVDEQEMTATLIWSYSHPNELVSLNQGSAQRLENGNTLISWGGVSNHGQLITEVDYDGNRVLEIEYPDNVNSYKVRKSTWEFAVNLVPADVNLDDNVDILDIILIVNFILAQHGTEPFYLFKADADRSGGIDVSDIILIVESIL